MSLFPSPEPRASSPRPGFFCALIFTSAALLLDDLRGGLRLRQIFEAVEAEEFEKPLGGPVKNRPARHFGAAGNADKMLLHQTTDRFTAGHAADRLYVGSQNRLLVGNDGQ